MYAHSPICIKTRKSVINANQRCNQPHPFFNLSCSQKRNANSARHSIIKSSKKRGKILSDLRDVTVGLFFGSTVWNVVCSLTISHFFNIQKKAAMCLQMHLEVASGAANTMFLITFHYVQCSASYLGQVSISIILFSYLFVNENYSTAHMRFVKNFAQVFHRFLTQLCFENHCSTQGYVCSYVLHLQNHKSDIKTFRDAFLVFAIKQNLLRFLCEIAGRKRKCRGGC